MPRYTKQREQISEDAETIVARVFEKLASILLRLAFDAPRSEALLRRAFIAAATRKSRTSGKRSTQSQIALIAGVNRLDVRKILVGLQPANPPIKIKARSRVDRILDAWRRDPDFSNGRGRAKELTFKGPRSQFERLVRKYGRDITVKTLRDDLLRNEFVNINGNRMILVARASPKAPRTFALADLEFLDSQLSLFDFQSGRRAFLTRSLNIRASDAKMLKLLQRKSAAKLESALNALESLRRTPAAPINNRRRGRVHRLLITSTLLAESDDKPIETLD